MINGYLDKASNEILTSINNLISINYYIFANNFLVGGMRFGIRNYLDNYILFYTKNNINKI